MIRRRRAVTGLLLLAIQLLVLASCFPVVVVAGDGSAAAEATEARAAEDGSCALNDSDSAENVNNDNINNGSKGDTKQQQQQDGETTATTDTTADTSTPPQVSHATLILENKEQVTVELTDDIMQRIHETLRVNGVLGGDNQALIQQLAMEEVHKWHQEQEQAQRSREQLLEQRRLQKQQQQEEESKPVFPYKLTLPPPPSWKNGKFYYNLDFVKDWTPQGGGRYAEYASGTSPYSNVSSQEQQNYSDEIARLRRPYIQQAMQHAWDGYRQYAFGYDEVRPQSRQGTNHWGGIGVTLVDSLDTLWIMNMHEEFQQARDWVHDTLSHDQNTKVSVFETTIRSLGGLLSAYDWSRDVVFLEEALDLARRLMRAFVHPVVGETILPFGEVNLQDGSCNMIPWAGGNAILSEFGTLQIEFRYLDEVVQTSETRGFRDKVEGIFELLHELSPDNGLFPYYMKTNHNGNKNNSKQKQQQATNKPYFSNDHLTFGAMADSFYEYMLKLWIQGGKTEPMYRTMYDKAMQGMHDELLHISSPSGLLYLADKVGSNKKRIKHKMDHLVCFVGGMLALGAYTDPLGLESERAQRDLQTAKVRLVLALGDIGISTRTCPHTLLFT